MEGSREPVQPDAHRPPPDRNRSAAMILAKSVEFVQIS